MSTEESITIDGGILEGGGQILRMSVIFSALLKRSIKVINIRAGRSKPGLSAQHLSGLQLVRDISSNSVLIGDKVGSTEIQFHPGTVKSGDFISDTGTAGSTQLLVQVSLPLMLLADSPCRLTCIGGTNADFAPPVDFTQQVLHSILEKFSTKFDLRTVKRGYYPRGGGKITLVTVPQSNINPIILEQRGDIKKISGISYVAGVLPIKMAHDMADAALHVLRADVSNDVKVDIERIKYSPQQAEGNGSGLFLVAETSQGCMLSGFSLGKRGVENNKVGEDSAKILLRNIQHGGCVDEYLQDQLIVFMALARGKSSILTGPVTLHTKTAIYIAELLAEVKFNIRPIEGSQMNVIECEGIGISGNFKGEDSCLCAGVKE